MLQTCQSADVLVIILHLSVLAIDSSLLTPDFCLLNLFVFSFHKSFDILCKGTKFN